VTTSVLDVDSIVVVVVVSGDVVDVITVDVLDESVGSDVVEVSTPDPPHAATTRTRTRKPPRRRTRIELFTAISLSSTVF
jgi:hypothetical protein